MPLVRRLLDEPNIVGLKDSSGDAALFAGFCGPGRREVRVPGRAGRRTSDWRDGVLSGAAGSVPGVGMLAPALCVDLFQLATQADHAAAAERQRQRRPADRRYSRVRPGASGVVVVKTALHLLGLCPPQAAAPFQACTETELAALRESLAGLADVLPRPATTG